MEKTREPSNSRNHTHPSSQEGGALNEKKFFRKLDHPATSTGMESDSNSSRSYSSTAVVSLSPSENHHKIRLYKDTQHPPQPRMRATTKGLLTNAYNNSILYGPAVLLMVASAYFSYRFFEIELAFFFTLIIFSLVLETREKLPLVATVLTLLSYPVLLKLEYVVWANSIINLTFYGLLAIALMLLHVELKKNK